MPKSKNISSAAMTGWWRAQEPDISFDDQSCFLVSTEEQESAETYRSQKYPLAHRHFSTRNRWFLERTSELLNEEKYDAVISLGSGFSLLTYYLAARHPNIKMFDIDLPDIIAERSHRIQNMTTLEPAALKRTSMVECDLEKLHHKATQSQKSFQEALSTLLEADIQRPIFIMEGLIYFLSPATLTWIFEGIANYEHAGIVFDYWAEEFIPKSECYRNALAFFASGNTPQTVLSILNEQQFQTLTQPFSLIRQDETGEAEKEFVTEENRQLTDSNQYIPALYTVLKK